MVRKSHVSEKAAVMIHTICVMIDSLNRPKPYGPVSIGNILGNVQRVCSDGVFTTIDNW